MKRKISFAILAAVGLLAIVLGIKAGDPETIHRFAAQI
jgi:hypothetical protein